MKVLIIAFSLALCAAISTAQTLTVDAGQVLCRIEPLIYGAGAEDVNHEIYGGLYDQKIFGEGFEEPAFTGINGFKAYDEQWSIVSGMAQLQTSRHGKLIYEGRQLSSGIIEVEVRMDDVNAIAGLIVNVTNPAGGADAFNGYELALNARKGSFVLGKHQQNWQPISDTPMSFNPLGEWNKIRVLINGAKLKVYLNDSLIKTFEDANSPLESGYVGLRSFGGSATFRNLKINKKTVAFESDAPGVSGMWSPLGDGDFEVDASRPFTGRQSQRISGHPGTGIYNMGLNRWGISYKKDQPLHLSLYLKGDAAKVGVALQSRDGSKEYARTGIDGITEEWKRFDVELTPNSDDPAGRFAIELAEEGCVWVDQVLLCTDSYPFRSDITEAFRQEHLTFLRYGGTMVNAREYMTRNMIGSRLERQPYLGHWYRYATNGFAIPEFVEFARLIGTEPTFAVNIEDNPEDVLALLHEIEPYGLKFIEIGNEECIGSSARSGYEHYVERYLTLYNAIHKVWPDLQFINAAWWRPKEMETMKYVFDSLDGKCDFWDYHPWTETPQQALNAEAEITQMKELFLRWNPNTTMRCAILEENGNTHDMARALAHAVMLNVVRRAGGFVPLDSPANALQPYKQNDNGWDQGQIFFSPSRVWMQPPFYAQQMAATNHQPLLVGSSPTSSDGLDYTATRNEKGDTLVLHIVNYGSSDRSITLDLQNFDNVGSMRCISLCGTEKGENTPQTPTSISPNEKSIEPGEKVLLEAYSYTVVVIAKNNAPDHIRWVESIKVLSPAPCSDISGRVKVGLQAKGMKQLKAQCCDGTRQSQGIKLDEDGAGSFWLDAKKLPHGPLTVQITGDNEAGERDLYELQLYNTAGRATTAGIPDTIPSAARGMHLVFSDDFDGPLSISRDGRGARYNAHKPTFGDFSGWPFSDPEGSQNPFRQRDTYLIIRAHKAEGTRGSTGLIATVDMDGNGFRATPPCYMECRLMAHSAPGTWPAFWTVTNIHRGEGDELDILEAYGGWGEGNPSNTGYHVTSHFWGQKDADGEPLKHPGKLIEMTKGRLGTSWSQTFHTYGLRIDSLQTTYYLDDEEVWSHPTNSYSYQQPHVLLVNYAIGGASGWKINLERYNNTSEMYVDYLRVFGR